MSDINERREELKAEKSRKKKGECKVKAIRYVFGCQIIKFEKRCFGWHYRGHTVDDDVSYEVTDSGKVKKNHKITKYAYFVRPKVWENNFLFGLTETISKIFSFVRRVLINAIVIGIILFIVGIMTENSGLALGVGLAYGISIAGSFIFAGLGALWKKVFKLEEKTDEILVANGFDVWASVDDGETI